MKEVPNRIFFDFDGTLVDSRKRLYELFRELRPDCALSFDEYWKIKRSRVDQKTLLKRLFGCEDAEIAEFARRWRERVEDDDLLKLDRPFPFAEALLKRLSSTRGLLFLVTARQHPEKAERQLEHWGWRNLFEGVFVTRQTKSKAELVEEKIGMTDKNDVFVGDTGEDILAGKKLGMKTIAVASGFLSREILREYSPDLLVNDVGEIYEDNLL